MVMEGTPALYTLRPSSRSRIQPERAASKTRIVAPYNSPASSIILSPLDSATGCDRKQRRHRLAGREVSAARRKTYDSVIPKGSCSSHVTTEISNQFDRVAARDRKRPRVRLADLEASVESVLKIENVPWTYDPVLQEGPSSSRLTAEMSRTSVPVVHYSKEREICGVLRQDPAIAPVASCRPVVVQVDDSDNGAPSNRIAVECRRKSGAENAYVLGYRLVKECRICLKPFWLMSMAARSREIPTVPNSTIDSNFIYKEIALPGMCIHRPVRDPRCRAFCVALSWMTTLGGLASYVYVLALFLCSNVEWRSPYPLVVLFCNVCLAIALFCNCML